MPGANVRAMSEEERRVGFNLQQDLLNKVGDFVTKGNHWNMNVTDRTLYERMRAAFFDYNQWLQR